MSQNIEEKKKDDNNLVPAYKHEILNKSNFFIGMKYKATVLENKITYLAMLKIQDREYEREPDGIYVEIKASEIKEAVKGNSGSFYEALKSAANSMTGNNMGIVDDEGQRFTFITLINKASYADGIFTVRFPNEIDGKLINVENNFTRVPKNIAMNLNKAPSFSLYQILKQQCYYPSWYKGPRNNKFQVAIGLAELKLEIGVVNANATEVRKILNQSRGTQKDYEKAVAKAEGSKEAMYKRWDDFNKKCLKPAIDEINRVSDIYVEYEKQSGGRGGKVYGVEFTVWLDGAEEQKEEVTPVSVVDGQITLSDTDKFYFYNDVVSIMDSMNLQLSEIIAISEAANYDKDAVKRAKSLLDMQRGKIENPTGWLISCLKENYQTPNPKPASESKNSFSNFEQRDQDYDKLENIFLNTHIE